MSDTFLFTLPDGQRVRCWEKDRAAIQADVRRSGNVFLIRDPGTEVYDRVAPESIEAAAMTPMARRVT